MVPTDSGNSIFIENSLRMAQEETRRNREVAIECEPQTSNSNPRVKCKIYNSGTNYIVLVSSGATGTNIHILLTTM